MQQPPIRERIESVIGHPLLVPASSSHYVRTEEDIVRFDPHALPDDLVSESPSSILKREIATRTSEDITNGLMELFREAAEELPRCKPFVRAFLSTRMAHVGMAAELPCGSWECQKCGPKLKLKWYLRHVNYIADAPFLERIFINKDDWQATHRMINRQGEMYLKYEQHDGSLLLLTTARLGGTEIKLEDREYEVVKALIGTAFTRQPVSQSRNWMESGNNTEEQPESNWMPLDSLRFTELDEVIKALTTMNIPTTPHSIYSRTFGSMRAATFRIPEGRFWETLWSLGACARNQPSNGPKESRETLWEWDTPPNPN
jgi:hypothetical protein